MNYHGGYNALKKVSRGFYKILKCS